MKNLLVLSILVFGFNVQASMSCPDSVELETARLINVERQKAGLAPLIYDVRLGSAAERHSDDMATNCFMSHTGSDGSSFVNRSTDAAYYNPSGEIVAAGYSTPSQVVAGWMNSAGHRAIILTAGNKHFGGARVSNSRCNYGTYWTFIFGVANEPAASLEQSCSAALPPVASPTPVPVPSPVPTATPAPLPTATPIASPTPSPTPKVSKRKNRR